MFSKVPRYARLYVMLIILYFVIIPFEGHCRDRMHHNRHYDRLLFHCIHLLLEIGADPNQVDINGNTALDLLAYHSSSWVRFNCSRLLVIYGAHFNNSENCHGETFYLDDEDQDSILWHSSPQNLRCLSALAITDYIRRNENMFNNQEVPIPLITFTYQHPPIVLDTLHFDAFFKSFNTWNSSSSAQKFFCSAAIVGTLSLCFIGILIFSTVTLHLMNPVHGSWIFSFTFYYLLASLVDMTGCWEVEDDLENWSHFLDFYE